MTRCAQTSSVLKINEREQRLQLWDIFLRSVVGNYLSCIFSCRVCTGEDKKALTRSHQLEPFDYSCATLWMQFDISIELFDNIISIHIL